jgi:hypothetical protein
MKIDITTTSYAIVRGLSNQDGSAEALQMRTGNELPASGDAVRTDESDAASTVVSISESARLAAQSPDLNEQQQATLDASTQDTSNPSTGTAQTDLDQLMIALWSGRKILGVSAADLQAVRDGAANSDLQLKLMEQAALRAGYGIQRHIQPTHLSVDQTTFQARGVIRTDEGLEHPD